MSQPEFHSELGLIQRATLFGFVCCIGAYLALSLSAFLFVKEHSKHAHGDDESSDEQDKTQQPAASAHSGDKPQASGPVVSAINTPRIRLVFQQIAIVALIMLYGFINEHTDLIPKTEKFHDIDVFWFLAGLLVVAAVLTIKPSRGNAEVLNRDQTEEWKGWMQFLFLLYHYQHATDVYNLIRVFVSAYVWMTGFGNFSFFYLRADYSLARFLQMMWRLNFLVLIIIATMGTNYILYYIVPLHTAMFLMVLTTMGVGSSINYTWWGPRIKIFIVAMIIYCVWELEDNVEGIFDFVFYPFGFLLRENNGSFHEWHFRTFLDHYSTVLGMVFAMNFPYLVGWFHKVEKLPFIWHVTLKSIVGILFASLTFWWYNNVFLLSKYPFNAAHPYWMWIPIFSWIYFRNITKTLRSYHSGLLNYLGKITLETYLLQFHVFMRARRPGESWSPTTLLALVPDWPYCNMLLTGIIFIVCARYAFIATLTLRDEFLSSSTTAGWTQRLLIALLISCSFLLLAFAMPFNDHDLLLALGALCAVSFVAILFYDLRRGV